MAIVENNKAKGDYMKRVYLMGTIMGFLVLASVAQSEVRTDQSMKIAKERVFPALVFIQMIRESHESGEKSAQSGAGSGVLISQDGEFLTNWHVVDKAESLRCLLTDGRSFSAEVIGSDKDTDIALCRLKLPKEEKVPFASLGNSDLLTEGDPVYVMGAPWGMSRSVSAGIISCTRRYLKGASEYALWLQTDASINPGNSGGPMVNQAGDVIGITARGAIFGGDLGFAIPAKEVSLIAGRLRQFKHMNWSWTGLQIQPLRDFDKNVYFEFDSGVIISATDPESPARRAGIQPKDRLVAINGEKVTAVTNEDLPAVNRMLGLLEKEKPATLSIIRDNATISVTVTPRDKGKVEGEEKEFPRWDFSAKVINQFDTPDLYFYQQKGVFIFAVKYPGNAASAGLAQNDIILNMGGKAIESLDQLMGVHQEAIKNMDKEFRIPLTVLRNGQRRQVILDFSRDYKRR
jgi:serine protease Do